MVDLNDFEMDITKELISISLANSADAFSKMANEKVLIQGFDLKFLEPKEVLNLLDHEQEHLHVLTTEVRGKLLGKSYLIFNHQDADKVFNVFAPGQKLQENGQLNEFQNAILLELDNILSAAVVTQLSNILGLFTYGDVPFCHSISKSQAIEGIKEDTHHYDVIFQINSKFHAYKTNMSPRFIWLFKSEFLRAIKDLVANKQQLSLLKSQVTTMKDSVASSK